MPNGQYHAGGTPAHRNITLRLSEDEFQKVRLASQIVGVSIHGFIASSVEQRIAEIAGT